MSKDTRDEYAAEARSMRQMIGWMESEGMPVQHSLRVRAALAEAMALPPSQRQLDALEVVLTASIRAWIGALKVELGCYCACGATIPPGLAKCGPCAGAAAAAAGQVTP